MLGGMLHESGRLGDAMTGYQKALDIEPDNDFTKQKLREIQDKITTAEKTSPSTHG